MENNRVEQLDSESFALSSQTFYATVSLQYNGLTALTASAFNDCNAAGIFLCVLYPPPPSGRSHDRLSVGQTRSHS
jgi:hypothetical protein